MGLTGVSGRFACDFRTDLHFADGNVQSAQDQYQEGGRTTAQKETLLSRWHWSSQFAENVSWWLVHRDPPTKNQPVRSVLHQLTGAHYAKTKVTITPLAKWCTHEIYAIYRSITSLFPSYNIFNVDRMVVKKPRFSASLAVSLKAAEPILKLS